MAIGVALIGYGYWGKIIRKCLDNHKGFELKYICFPSASPGGIFVNSMDRIGKDDSVNAVIVATPIATHYEIVKGAILTGKHVMCEKPLVTNKEQATALKNMAESHGVKVVTDFTYTFSPGIRRIKEILKRGTIGDIDYIEMRMLQYGRFSADSVFDVLASHFLSVLCQWGLTDGTVFEFKPLITRGRIVETGEVNFRNGAFHGKITVSLNSPVRERTINIFGDKGFITFNPLRETTLQVFAYEGYNQESNDWSHVDEYKFDESNNLTNALDYFYETLAGSEEGNLNVAEKVAEILEKAL